jgi:hypothetical protein
VSPATCTYSCNSRLLCSCNPYLLFSTFQVEELIEAALDQGLDPKQLLAEAMALGVVIPAAAAAQAGIQLPSKEQVGGWCDT